MKTIHVCYYLYVLLFSTSQFVVHASDDRLKPRESITVDESLVSAGGSFSLGFFSPSNLSHNLYVGIWFNNMGPRRVVWVANREKPVKDSSAVLRLSSDGVLSILDAMGEVYWSAGGVGQVGSTRNDTVAILLDTGNLVIREGGNVTVWQSFDHPGDAALPGMRIGFSRKSNAVWRLTSWKDAEDPSPGNFSLDYDPKTTLQLYIWRGSELYARGVMRNGYHDSFTEGSSFLVYETYIDTDDEFYVTITITDGSPKVWYRLDYTGQLQVEGWDDGSKSWVNVLSWPNKDCDLYGFCGPFGYCDKTKQAPTCICLEGFEPRVWSDWSSGNFSAGCIRKKDLQCGSGGGDVFVTVQGLKVPANYEYLPNVSMDSCRTACLGNCSCTAYNQGSLGTENTTIPRCLLWMGELIDSQKMDSRWSEDLHLRVASSGSDKSATRRKIMISILILTIGGVVLLAAVTCLAWKLNSKDRSKNPKQGSFSANSKRELGGSDKKLGEAKSGKRKDVVGNTDGSIELPMMKFETILAATNNFADGLKIGQGGFGIVYLGTLPDGHNIAIKRLTKGSGQGLKEFNNEIILIAKLQHRNLVRLLGCCAEGDEKLLVYEYMPNKSLDAFLFDPTKKSMLDWAKRFNIIKGIARALLYLHQDSRLRIIHRDLKGSNILLDEDMNPKVSDFGMARIFGNDQNQANTNRVVGTYGYMAPEYAMEGRFSTKSDVYSFGVLVLELLSGARNIGFDHILGYPNLLIYAWSLWVDGRSMDFIDASIRESCSRDEALNCMHVGLLCIQNSPDDRPTISSIVLMLENGSTSSATPKQPIFLPHRNPVLHGTHLDVQNLESHSINDLTITTMVEGR